MSRLMSIFPCIHMKCTILFLFIYFEEEFYSLVLASLELTV